VIAAEIKWAVEEMKAAGVWEKRLTRNEPLKRANLILPLEVSAA